MLDAGSHCDYTDAKRRVTIRRALKRILAVTDARLMLLNPKTEGCDVSRVLQTTLAILRTRQNLDRYLGKSKPMADDIEDFPAFQTYLTRPESAPAGATP